MSAVQAMESLETDADWKEGPGSELKALLILVLFLFWGGGAVGVSDFAVV